MSEANIATGDLAEVDAMASEPDSHVITCPVRRDGCVYSFGPDRPDARPLSSWVNFPYCPNCGEDLVIMPRDEYEGPTNDFH